MIRNRYNQIPHAVSDTTRERNTNNQDGIKKTQHKRKAERSALSQLTSSSSKGRQLLANDALNKCFVAYFMNTASFKNNIPTNFAK